MGFQGSVDDPLPLRRESNEGASSVVGIGPALDEPSIRQAVESLGGTPGGEQGPLGELCGGELIGSTLATQRGQQVEPAGLEPVRGDPFRQCGVDQAVSSRESPEHADRTRIHVGTLATPLREDLVDVVG